MALSPTQRQSFTLSDPFTPASLGFAQFDPALGTLTGVTMRVTAVATGIVSVENLELGPVTVQAALPVAVTAYGQDFWSLGTGTATARGTAMLAAFDGTADFEGASGTVLALSGGISETLVLGADDWRVGAFMGIGAVSLRASGSNSLAVSGGAGMRLLSAGGPMEGEIAVTYEYTPADGTTGSVIGSVITVVNPPVLEVVGSAGQTVTTARQLRSVAAKATGWTESVTVDGFDPALGTLVAVNLRVRTALQVQAGVENKGRVWGYASIVQGVTTTASVAGGTVAVAVARSATDAGSLFLSESDGVDDFGGSGGSSQVRSAAGHVGVRVTDPQALAGFAGAGPVEVVLQAGGTGQVSGMADLLVELTATASAVLEVSYSYAPAGEIEAIAVANGSQGTRDVPVPASYAGPVAGIVNSFARITPDSLAVSAATDSWYIRTGSGTDAIQVSGGTNVLDGGGGSNYLVGGVGQDTFFVDATWTTEPLWNTIDGFSPGDAATIWGITSSAHLLSWRDGQGAPGAQGLTLHARAPGLPPVSTTFVGYSTADLSNGVLEVSYGTADDVPYMHVRAV